MPKLFTLAVAVTASLLVLQPLHPKSASAAEKWVPVGQESGLHLSVDANSIKKKGDIVWFWAHMADPKVSQGPQQVLIYASANCRSRIARIRKVVLYNQQGKPIDSTEPGDAGPLSNAIPNNDPLLRYVCARR